MKDIVREINFHIFVETRPSVDNVESLVSWTMMDIVHEINTLL